MPSSNTHPGADSTPCLLLVDDDRLTLSTLGAGLRHMGYQTQLADSVDAAMALLQTGPRPQLAILDVHLSGRSGLWLAQWLSEVAQLPFLMLSAHGDMASVQQATHSGALGYLVKPLTLQQVQPAVETALQRAQELEGLRRSSAQLQQALDADREVSVAVGVAMAQYRMAQRPAFELLRGAARKQRRKLAEVAREVIQACEKLHH